MQFLVKNKYMYVFLYSVPLYILTYEGIKLSFIGTEMPMYIKYNCSDSFVVTLNTTVIAIM